MKQRRKIRGVLNNFLGTYTSRYSDYDGYWLFGILLKELDGLEIDLLVPPANNSSKNPVDFAVQLARQKFAEQLSKNAVAVDALNKALLTTKQIPQQESGFVNGRLSAGQKFSFTVKAETFFKKTYQTSTILFIAPHDPNIESRSTRRILGIKSN